MPVIAVINRKGGSGKSTLATHIAAYLANKGASVMLGDIDRQQSSKTWLRLRGDKYKPILGWAVDHQYVRRLPTGVSYAVIDTPGGLHGFDLAKVAMSADYILMPVCGSIFDRESAADCLAELKQLPRISTGRCKVAVVGMRLDSQSATSRVVENLAAAHQTQLLATIKESRAYVNCIEQGMTIFDMENEIVKTELADWDNLLAWIAPEYAPGAIGALANANNAILANRGVPAAMQRKLNMASAGNRGVLPTSSLRPATQPGFRPTYPSTPGGQAQADEQKAWFEANAIPAFLRPKA